MLRRDFPSGRRHFGLAGQLNPNDANITIARGLASAFLGDAEKGLLLAQKAIRLNPFHPDYYFGYLATIQFLAERYDEAVATIDLAPDVWPESAAWYAAACAHLGRIGRAKKAAENFLADVSAKWIGDPNATPADYVRWLLQANSIRRYEDIQRLLEGLGKAGLPQVENPGLVS